VSPRDISVVAHRLPGDELINYTSPYAGGNFLCITGDDDDTLEYDRATYAALPRIQQALGGAERCGLDRCPLREFWDARPSDKKLDSLRLYLDEYTEISHDQLPRGAAYGISFLLWSFNCPRFLLTFGRYLSERGVTLVRRHLLHIDEAFESGVHVVINCTGLGASTLGGVQDRQVYPTRGQVVVVKAPHVHQNVLRWGGDYATYLIKRPFSNDQLVLGGLMQADNWLADTLGADTIDILERVSALYPPLLTENPRGPSIKDLEVLRVVAGLRPSRHGGVRIEREPHLDAHRCIVHNYGASGYGYQAGFGMGQRAAALAMERDAKL
jgi:D-amino-acid oxidase